jgi:PAS domain S-box-containing protein
MIDIQGIEVIGQIYESSNSLIFKARRTHDAKPVILKVLRPDYSAPEAVVKYRQEYRITSNLGGVSGVIDVYGLDRSGNTLSMILEDFGGQSLDILMKVSEFSTREYLDIAVQIVETLGEIHARNVIHKDINPSNIVFNPETGQLKIIDFGVSTVLSREHPALKSPEALEGTPGYLAPEQTGRMNRSIDYRSDYYALGITFYELLTGKLPYETTDLLEQIHCHIARLPVSPHGVNNNVPRTLSDIVMLLMAKNPEDRYQSASGIKADLYQCIERLDSSGAIESFELGTLDIPERFEVPQKLYGRQREIEILVRAMERVSQGNKEMILVSGPPGIGKTSLVREIHKPMTIFKGHFISGKFDQFQGDFPYLAVMNAFRDLAHLFLSGNELQLHRCKQDLLNALGTNSQVIIDLIPEMELILGPQPPVPELDPLESQNRFELTFKNFIRVLRRSDNPLVIFLDDLQWADLPSLKLLELMMTDETSRHLLLIGAYRDIEAEMSHPLGITLNSLREAGVETEEIRLGPLGLDHINDLLSEALHSKHENVEPLARVVEQKTGGNPFFVVEFIKDLHQDGLLSSDNTRGAWLWDFDRIRSLATTDNLVEFMANKIRTLQPGAQDALKLAASIGSRFDLRTLALVTGHELKALVDHLTDSLEHGLILALGEGHKRVQLDLSQLSMGKPVEYRFCHDHVQQAAYSLIEDDEKASVHIRIGKTLLEDSRNLQKDQRIFDIVNQMNRGIHLIESTSERSDLARLYLTAGKRAKALAAYQPAFDYLKTGLKLLEEDSWDEDYEMTLEMHRNTMEAAYLVGDWKETDRLASVIDDRAGTLLDRVSAGEIRIRAYYAQHMLREGLDIGLRVLGQLGVQLPAKPTKSKTLLGLLRFRLALGSKTIEDLYDLPQMTDPLKLAAMRVLSSVAVISYVSAPEMLPLLIFNLVSLSIKHGNSHVSPFGYAALAHILCGPLNQIDYAYRFGRLALRVAEDPNTNAYTSRTMAIFNYSVRPYREHFRENLNPFLNGYRIGLETGDFQYAALSRYGQCLFSFFMGTELDEVEQDMVSCHEALVNLKQEHPFHAFVRLRQTVQNLRVPSENPCSLHGVWYDLHRLNKQFVESNEVLSLFGTQFYEMMLSYLFHDYSRAVERSNEAAVHVERLSGVVFVSWYHFYDSLARLALYPSVNGRRKDREMALVASSQKKMKRWAHHAPMNYLHKYYLVEAERFRVKGKTIQASQLYDQSIALAKENGFLNEEALAYELAADFYSETERTLVARAYAQEAQYCYRRWGAQAKVEHLEERYGSLLVVGSSLKQATTMQTQGTSVTESLITADLDLDSVLKASLAISGEIDLRDVLEKLIQIVMENAGAQRGMLILESAGRLLIEAEGEVDGKHFLLLHSQPVEECDRLSSSVVNLVARTRESIVLHDASGEGEFSADPYVLANKPRSVLCFPLIHQGALSGILYLENNRAAGTFTPERIELIRLLSSQAAISLENARHYELRKRAEAKLAVELNKFQTLYKLALAMTTVRSLDETLRLVAEKSRELLKTEVTVIALRDDEAGDLYVHTVLGMPEEFKQIRVAFGRGLGGRIVASGKGVIVDDVGEYFRKIGSKYHDMICSEGFTSGVAAPIQMGETNLGVLYVINRTRTEFSQADLETLSLVGNLLAVEVARTRAVNQLRVAHEDLELRVEQRTAELVRANNDLKREISERRKAELALGESEAKYRFLAENVQDIMWTVDMNLKTTYVSPSVCKILGFTPAERSQQSINDQMTAESVALALSAFQEELARDKEEGMDPDRPVTLALDFKSKVGEPVCLETVMSFIRDGNGNPIGVLGLSRDITERKRTEQAVRESQKRLADIIDFLPDATFVIDNDGTVVAWNRAIEEMTGIPSHQMIGKGNYEYALPFYGERRPLLIDLVNERCEEYERKYMNVRQKGTTLISESYHPLLGPDRLYLSGTARRLYDSQGEKVGSIESIRDITSRKRTEEALKHAKEAAESATRARSEFLANMSHEIRTPLNAVQGMIDLLLETELTNVQHGRLQIIKAAADSLLTLLNDILDFSKIDAGKLHLEEIDFDIRATLSSAVALLQMRVQDKNLDLRYHMSDAVPQWLRGDPNRLRQVVLNLANNAIKFTNHGQVAIEVNARTSMEDHVVLHFAVSDTGIGISPENLRVIFDRFSQADSSTTRKYGGTGLGLAIASQLVKAMGGTIWADSEPNKGSTFHFSVGLGLGTFVPDADIRATSQMPSLNHLTGTKVLLVEDNLFNQAVAAEVLKKIGCDVVVAASGREAVDLFDRQPFDIILMDLQMPEMDGFEATRLIREKETLPRIPIIAQTAHVFEEDRDRCFAAGMDEHLEKPIKASELLRVLQKYTSRTKQRSAANLGATTGQGRSSPADQEIRECFDHEDLLYRLDGDEEAMKEMVGIFMDVTPPQIADLKTAHRDRDWERLGRLSHSVKGSCGSFGARAMRDTAAEMELTAKRHDAGKMQELVKKMSMQFDELQRTLDELGIPVENTVRNGDETESPSD